MKKLNLKNRYLSVANARTPNHLLPQKAVIT